MFEFAVLKMNCEINSTKRTKKGKYMLLNNKTAIITGSSRGIGYYTALKFVKEGANVIIVDLNEEGINAAIEKLEKYEDKVKGFVADISKKQQVNEVVQFAIEQFGTLDILVNNAGTIQDAQLINMEEGQWEQVIDVNLKGTFLMTQIAERQMKEQKEGVILNASSVVSHYGNFGQSNYVASKAGINGLTKTWAKELGRYNIRVNSVAPGFISTDMINKIPDKVLNGMKEKSLLNRLGSPNDIANAYAFLASDNANFITGTTLNVDGGLVL